MHVVNDPLANRFEIWVFTVYRASPTLVKMSYMLQHLHNGWQVDQAILSEEDRALVIRFGHDWDPTCMKMDEVLYSIAEKVDMGPSLKYCCSPTVQDMHRPSLSPMPFACSLN